MQCKLFDIQLKIRMTKNQTTSSRVQNILALNRVKKECYYEPIRVDFSPIQKPNNLFENIIPIFNNDRNYFTPAFALKKQITLMAQNTLTEKNKFHARITHAQKPSENLTPEYRATDDDYCQLCSQYFTDYFEHINDKYHKRMINSSKFNKDIMALCQSFESQVSNKDELKTKKIVKQKVCKKGRKNENSFKKLAKSKEQEQKGSMQLIKIQTKTGIQRENMEIMNSQCLKNFEQSLDQRLQGNYSTNIQMEDTFKQLCQQS